MECLFIVSQQRELWRSLAAGTRLVITNSCWGRLSLRRQMSLEESAQQEPGGPLDLSGMHFDEDNCAICLEPVKDRCILPRCFHSCFCLCFIVQWAQTQEKEKTCPLCVTPIGQHVLHALDPVSQRFLTFSLNGGVDAAVDPSVLGDESPDEAPDEASPQSERPARPRLDLQTIRRREEARHRRKMNDALRARRTVYRYHLYAKVCRHV